MIKEPPCLINIKLTLILFFAFSFSERSYSQAYFQQQVNYKIDVRLDDATHFLHCSEEIIYINNSPDTLREIYFHLWANAYKNNETALAKQLLDHGSTRFYFADEKDRGYIDSLDFSVNGKQAEWSFDKNHIDICILKLKSHLLPGDSITITTPFRVKIPSAQFSRLGHIDQAYYITQWYPKPAVYDRSGWNPMPYLDQGEFYSEFGSFDVSITLPSNYRVGATGDLQNENEKLWLDSIASVTKSIIEFNAKDMAAPLSSPEFKTIRFTQQNVHDFAWFADKRYHVLKSEVELPFSKRKVNTWLMFTNYNAMFWKDAIPYINDAVYYYSLWSGEYPYNNVSAVDGFQAAGGGMEYPNITVINAVTDALMLEFILVHEVGHNWFYGALGSNERQHPWMDEGVNSLNEMRYFLTKYPGEKGMGKNDLGGESFSGKLVGANRMNYKAGFLFAYRTMLVRKYDQPNNLPAPDYTRFNYAAIVYVKTALAFDYLRSYLGDKTFDECMHRYFEVWKFKHPSPGDMENIFEDITHQNLDWFFKDLFETTNEIDYSVLSAKKKKGSDDFDVRIKNTGKIASPVLVAGFKDNKEVASKWISGFSGSNSVSMNCTGCDKFIVNPHAVAPEKNLLNNSIKTKGILKKTDPVDVNSFFKFAHSTRRHLTLFPAAGWNENNKLMLGGMIHNLTLPSKKLEFGFIPMYSISSSTLTGSGIAAYHLYPDKGFLKQVTLQSGFQSYGFDRIYNSDKDDEIFSFYKASPSIVTTFRKKNPLSHKSNTVTLKSILIVKEEQDYISGDEGMQVQLNENLYTHSQLIYQYANRRALDPFNIKLTAEAGNFKYFKENEVRLDKYYVKLSGELNYRLTYRKGRKSFDIRTFAGGIISDNQNNLSNYFFHTSGLNGRQDYLFDHVFPGRNSTDEILSKQFAETEGAFKIYTPTPYNKWLVAVNLKADLPFPLPIRAYADIGTYEGAFEVYEKENGLLFDAGFSFSPFRNFFEVYFPVIKSENIKQYIEVNDLKFGNLIRFTFNLSALNPMAIKYSIAER